MKYLGIDYGKRKVGLSVSEGITVSPLKILEVTSLIDALNKVDQVIQSEGITNIVIGVSDSGESRKMTKNFLQALQERTASIQIIEVFETLSTKRAQEQMIDFGTSKKSRKSDDASAAVIILEDYLESRGKV